MYSFHTLFSVVALCSLVAGHMATPHRRFIDTCANIDISLGVLDVLNVGAKVCACLGTTGTLIKENSSLYIASKVLGEAEVISKLTAAIQSGQGKCTCLYPDHAIPACSDKDLCYFDCPGDRIKMDGQCVCKEGHQDCNGKCVLVSQPCSSQGPKTPYTVHQISGGRNKRGGRGTPNWARRALSSAHCPIGTEMCGVLGRPDAWECLNVEEDLESCGGCAYPFFPGQKPGVDCSAIPGVEDVACLMGLCQISKCAANLVISVDGRACEPNEHAKSRDFISTGRANKVSHAEVVRMVS